MDNLIIHDGVVVVNEQAQWNEPIAQIPDALSALIEDAYQVVDDMVGLAYERDLINAELAQKRKQLCHLYTAMDHEYVATKSNLIAMLEPIWN